MTPRRIAVGLSLALALVSAPGARADDGGWLLERDEIVPAPSSTIIDSVDRTAGCGTVPSDARYAVDGDPSDWHGEATMISGTGRYDAGEYVWTDYAYDDDGTGALEYPGEGEVPVAVPGTAGRATPRQQRYGSNAADVVELRAAADGERLYVLVRLNFLNAVDSTVVGLAFDTDGNRATGTGDWPHGAGMRTPGADVFVTAHGTCASVRSADGAPRPLDDTGGAIAVSTRRNVLELAIPRALLGEASALRVAGGAGLWDARAERWRRPGQHPSLPGRTALSGNRTDEPQGAAGDGDPAVFNLLFRDDEGPTSGSTPRTFQSAQQHAALRDNTSGRYGATLEIARLAPGAASDPPLVRPGAQRAFTRLYRSRIDAEGVLVQGDFAVFLGRYQPYGVYLPACYEQGCARWGAPRPAGVVLVHGGGGSHTASLPGSSGELNGLNDLTATYAGIDASFAPLVVTALGRGQRPPWWRGLGEADVLELRDDAQRVYAPDRDRWLITGGSLGGYGTIRLASLYPELWAGAFAHCPAEFENSISHRYVGNLLPATQPFVIDAVMEGLLNVPFRQANGTLDPLVPILAGHRMRDTALAAGLDYQYTEYLAGGHCWDNLDGLKSWPAQHVADYRALAARPRAVDPARVRYAVDVRHYPAGEEPIGLRDLRDLGLRYDGAYWVSGLVPRQGSGVVASIDAASHALADRPVGARSCGTASTPLPSPRITQCQTQRRTDTRQPVLELRTARLAAAEIDLRRAGLRSGEVVLHAAGDGGLTLTLQGAGGRTAVGRCVTGSRPAGDNLVLELALGPAACAVAIGSAPVAPIQPPPAAPAGGLVQRLLGLPR